ncbi:hypothetical protein QT995_09585 [Microcoleus sp. S36b_A3]|uniref:hypothetical protein n=1 Tax=unclassified Microcoleus TaxID=2642155 RepID=UPI002FD6017A
MDNSVRPNLRYCIINRRKKEEGRRKFGNEQCTGCNGCKSVGRRKREEGRSPTSLVISR